MKAEPQHGAMRYELRLGYSPCDPDKPLPDPDPPRGVPRRPAAPEPDAEPNAEPDPEAARGRPHPDWHGGVAAMGATPRTMVTGLAREIVGRLLHVRWEKMVRLICVAFSLVRARQAARRCKLTACLGARRADDALQLRELPLPDLHRPPGVRQHDPAAAREGRAARRPDARADGHGRPHGRAP